MSAKKQVLIAGVLLLSGTVLSRVVGFLREVVLAALFGVSGAVDAYLVSLTVVVVVMGAVAGGIGLAFLPLYSERLRRGRESANAFASIFINIMLGISATAIIIGLAFTPQLVELLAPRFDGEVARLAVELTRLSLPSIFPYTIGAIMTAMLQAENRFGPTAIVGAVQNLLLVTGMLIAVPLAGIVGVSVATSLSVIAQILVQYPYLHRLGFRYQPLVGFYDSDVPRTLRLALPILLTSLMTQIPVIFDRVLASGLPEGRIAALNYAYRLYSVPLGLFGTVVATALYPAFSQEQDAKALAYRFGSAVRFVLLSLAPLTALMVVASRPLVRLAFQRGAFTPEDTGLTAIGLAFYGLGLIGTTIWELARRVFYSRGDSITPLWGSIFLVTTAIVGNLLLIGPMSHGGLALASSLAPSLGGLFLIVIFAHRYGGFSWLQHLEGCLKVLIAALLGGAGFKLTWWLLTMAVDLDGLVLLTMGLGVGTLVGAVAYCGAIWLLRTPGWRESLQILRPIFGRLRLIKPDSDVASKVGKI